MKKMILTLGIILMPIISRADVPTKINFQGRFNSTTTFHVNFHITASSPSSSPIWSETGVTIDTPNGVGNYLLGISSPISAGVFSAGSTRYLKIEPVSPSTGSDQYIPLVSIPYACVASYSDQLAGGTTVQGTLNITGNFTASTITVTNAILGNNFSARVTRSSTLGDQSLSANTMTDIIFDSEIFDNGNLHASGSNAALTAPISGIYVISANVQQASDYDAIMQIIVNDTDVIARNVISKGWNLGAVSSICQLTAGDTIKLQVAIYTAGGGSIKRHAYWSPVLSMSRISGN